MQQGAFSRAAQSIISRVAAAAGKTCVQGSGEKSTQIRRPSFNMAVSNGVSMRSMGMPSFTEYKNAGQEDTNFSPIPTLEELYNRVKGNADSSRGKTWDNSRAQSGWNSGNADDRVQSKKEDGTSEKTAENISKEDVNWGTLAYGTLEQGANDFISCFTSTLDMLAGDFAQEIWILGGLMFGISDAGDKPNYCRQQLYAGNDQKGSRILCAKRLRQQNSGKSEQIRHSRRICTSDACYGNDDRRDFQRRYGEGRN